MDSEIVLFISSTSDLRDERQALEYELRRLYRLFLYEDFGAGSDEAGNTSPEAILRERLRLSDIFICLLGEKYGSLYTPPGSAQAISIVEWEYKTAESHPKLAIMPFLKTVPEEKIDPPQRDFRNRVTRFGEEEQGRWCEKYASPKDLPKLVREAVEKWLARQYRNMRANLADWLLRALAPVALVLVLLCVIVCLLFVGQIVPFSQSSVFGFCGLVFFTLLLGFAALKLR